MRLFQVGHVVQTRRGVLSLAWDEWFSTKGRARMRDFLLWARVVVRTSSMKILGLRLADYEKQIVPKSVLHVQHDYFS